MERYLEILASLEAEHNLRKLRTGESHGKYVTYEGRRYINMSSNDYLGLAADVELQREFFEQMAAGNKFMMSSSASRLMTGNGVHNEQLEESLAAMYQGKSALVLGNGYVVNSGCLPALVSERDLVIADKLVHASIIDGLRLCKCDWTRFGHNDTDHLESLLKKKRGSYENVWVVAESVYSMDGDRAPLSEFVELKRRYDLSLYLDEAHAFGVFGPAGAGCAAEEGLDGAFDVIVGTFGKALASYGAFVALSPLMREVLVNRMRTLIFSTGLPPVNLLWTQWLVDRLPRFDDRRARLRELIAILAPGKNDATQIIPIPAGENSVAIAMSEKFREGGFWTTPIRWPTVSKGTARVRLSLTADMDRQDVERFRELWSTIG